MRVSLRRLPVCNFASILATATNSSNFLVSSSPGFLSQNTICAVLAQFWRCLGTVLRRSICWGFWWKEEAEGSFCGMTKAQVKTKYDATSNAATATLSLPVGDMKIKATCSDSTFVPGETPTWRGVSFGVEKPGTFMIDYDMQSEAPRFQFMVGASVAKKPLRLTYIHAQKRNATVLEANLAVDPRNKVVGKYSFNTQRGSLKYTYVHGSGATLEPSYDFHTESWHFAASRKVGSHDSARVCYDAHASTLGMEWTRDSKEFGQFKVTATVPTDTSKSSKLLAEKTWSVDF